jgi:8-oxo-dGTP diphosphatase
MSTPTEKFPRVGVATIILKEDYSEVPIILLGLRISKKNHGHNDWCLPGGKLDWKEELADCARRETLEECGLELDGDVELIDISNDFWPEADQHFVTMYYVSKRKNDADEPKLLEPEKCVRWEWFRTDQLPPNLMKGTIQALRKFELLKPGVVKQQENPIY